MNIYFCGSIRGGREDAALYHEMIGFLKQFGPVLTEHVGDLSLTRQGNDGTAEGIWQRDTAWLCESDIVIAECSQVSHGVGYELAFAEAHAKPVFVFYRHTDHPLSAMIAGDPHFEVYRYEDDADLFDALARIMRAFCAKN